MRNYTKDQARRVAIMYYAGFKADEIKYYARTMRLDEDTTAVMIKVLDSLTLQGKVVNVEPF